MNDIIKVAMIGLDTVHTIQFTKLIQGDAPAEQKVPGLQVVKAMRFPSAFHSEENQDKRQAQLEKWGVPVTRSLDEAVKDADVIMLEINDPGLHLPYFKQVVGLKKPIFMDKPMASSLEDAKAIADLAAKHKVKMWTSSPLRFDGGLVTACAQTPKPLYCNVYGTYNKAAPSGSPIVWYGVHAVEIISTILGKGAKSVIASKAAQGVTARVEYADGRHATMDLLPDAWFYGGRIQSAEKVTSFSCRIDGVRDELLSIRDYFHWGCCPVSLEDSLEIQAISDACDRSLVSGKEEALQV